MIQALFGFFLVLFIPGYAVTLVFYPEKNEISDVKRIGLSIVFSMISVILLVLFIDVVLAVNTTPLNIVGAILIFSLVAVCIWKAELFFNEKIPKFLSEKSITGRHILPVNLSALKFRSTSENTGVSNNKSQKEEKDDDL
ncbi:DUF1616 domain-containing protein [Methanogenium sp. MK-MG]|uniref:DUF1616 domain-containing protein n=1 Tax=Methanogenium sp. MK-MG TaxID=2599926 RepID=UPI0013EB27C5|nr:DUF1616 domain-containing protein [Methanogenium sp. MK-MG]KAF1073529.1 hypothetical protein MKMG_02138 [Methanogenium sp. MK-MG]